MEQMSVKAKKKVSGGQSDGNTANRAQRCTSPTHTATDLHTPSCTTCISVIVKSESEWHNTFRLLLPFWACAVVLVFIFTLNFQNVVENDLAHSTCGAVVGDFVFVVCWGQRLVILWLLHTFLCYYNTRNSQWWRKISWGHIRTDK